MPRRLGEARISKRLVVACLAFEFLAGSAAPGGDRSSIDPDLDAWVSKSMVIIRSTSSFTDAKAAALTAASRLNLKLDLRDLSESKRTGLTFARSVCAENGFSYPCYVARSRDDDGVYVSVEHSNAYEGFTKGLYIVVVASGAPDDPVVRDTLGRARQVYSDAYSKVTKVYMGCIH